MIAIHIWVNYTMLPPLIVMKVLAVKSMIGVSVIRPISNKIQTYGPKYIHHFDRHCAKIVTTYHNTAETICNKCGYSYTMPQLPLSPETNLRDGSTILGWTLLSVISISMTLLYSFKRNHRDDDVSLHKDWETLWKLV